ncbi:SH3 domain-containing protein [Streptomyces fumanus]|uniref:SH3b domain-containing protein n=1 Tax=Streptomyces fumanus TaxID=67302 RepID=A0A919AQD6_9ACTN|nr:SH3 domain-containing protein [Streptomyces fumanus]GHF19459.1 hypothetical protein GCM10018772_50920 [Streptomyces fumanus]
MSPHSPAARRLAMALAAGAVAAVAAAGPSAALGPAPGPAPRGDGPATSGRPGGDQSGPARYRGVVTAGTLALRSGPDRGSEVIRYAHRGETVRIYCKTGGETVDGNPLWYLLADGTWAWGSARYIDNIGPAPHWC